MLLGNVLRWETGYLGRQHPVLPAARRLRAQGEAARPARRARDGRVLRAARASTTRSRSARWPPATGTSATRRCSTQLEDALAGLQGRVPVRLPRARARALRGRRRRRARRARRVHACAARRPPASVCAFCRLRERAGARRRSTRRAGSAWTSRAAAARRRRPRAARRLEAAAAPHHARRGRRVPLATPASLRHDDLIGARRGRHRAHDDGRAPGRGAADAGRVRARDAARRAGDLPEGPRADPDARRHLPRRPGARVGRRVRRADDDAAARDRSDRSASSATSSATTSRDRAQRNVEGLPRCRRPAARRGARRLRRHRRGRTSTASCSTCPSRGGS